jgi:N-acylneuraminate cytidylyltransferase
VKSRQDERIAFFLPTRKGSERVSNKNTRPFAGIQGGLLAVKLRQLLAVSQVEEIVLSTNDERSIEIALSFNAEKIRVVERPEYLCLSSTNIVDFINYIPTIVHTEHIFWVHTTAPFVDANVYESALRTYKELVLQKNLYDSMLSVTKIQQFIWDKEKNTCINHNRLAVKWPRTQDLQPLYEINHAFYINSIDNYLKLNDRIGDRPYLYELDKLQSLDIDWGDDFALAEALYRIPPPPYHSLITRRRAFHASYTQRRPA